MLSQTDPSGVNLPEYINSLFRNTLTQLNSRHLNSNIQLYKGSRRGQDFIIIQLKYPFFSSNEVKEQYLKMQRFKIFGLVPTYDAQDVQNAKAVYIIQRQLKTSPFFPKSLPPHEQDLIILQLCVIVNEMKNRGVLLNIWKPYIFTILQKRVFLNQALIEPKLDATEAEVLQSFKAFLDLNFHPEQVKPIQKCSTLEECLQQSLVINKLSNESMESLPHETAVQLIVQLEKKVCNLQDYGNSKIVRWQITPLIQEAYGLSQVDIVYKTALIQTQYEKQIVRSIDQEIDCMEKFYQNINVHINVAVGICYIRIGKQTYLFMPYYELTFQDYLNQLSQRNERVQDNRIVLTIAHQLAEGLMSVHEVGYIHRDLKPANIFFSGENVLDENFVLMITDFDRAREADQCIDENKTTNLFTPIYMPPDGLCRQTSHDVWQYGYIILQLINSGAQILRNPSMYLSEEEYAEYFSPAKIRKLINDSQCLETDVQEAGEAISNFVAILTRCLSKDPNMRPNIRAVYEAAKKAKLSVKIRPCRM